MSDANQERSATGSIEGGVIVVAAGRIFVIKQETSGQTQTQYEEATIENLADAARVLSAWLDLSSEDHATECRRIHDRDQFLAYLRDAIRQ